MARAKKKAAKQPTTPAVVELHSEELGETRPFTPAHAARILARQQRTGRADWQPVKAADTVTD